MSGCKAVFVDLEEAAQKNDFTWAALPFYKDGKPYDGACPRGHDAGEKKPVRPLWGMTLLAAGSMRFKWNEKNEGREQFLSALCKRFGRKETVAVELIHSKTVFAVKDARDALGLKGDGIATQNKSLVPVVTAADCVPLYFFDSATGAFGAAHSGWKGTGIAANMLEAFKKNYGSKPSDVLVAVGPHIQDCCYVVDQERADYFSANFGSDCVKELAPTQQANSGGGRYALSLLRANLNCLLAAGVLPGNIVAAKNCVCCSERFGSFRRQAAFLDVPQEEKARLWTPQAAFVIMEEGT